MNRRVVWDCHCIPPRILRTTWTERQIGTTLAVLAITFGNRTISRQFSLVYKYNWACTVVMSGHTSDREEPSSSSIVGPPTKKHAVSRRTVEKWVVENNRALNTSWLKLHKLDAGRSRPRVFSECAVCSQLEKMFVSMRNYRPAFVESTTNVWTTAFKDHAATDTHANAMVSLLSNKQQARNTT